MPNKTTKKASRNTKKLTALSNASAKIVRAVKAPVITANEVAWEANLQRSIQIRKQEQVDANEVPAPANSTFARANLSLVDEEKSKLREMLSNHASTCWAIGDCLIRIEELGSKTNLAELEKEFGWDSSTLSLYRSVAKAIPLADRNQIDPATGLHYPFEMYKTVYLGEKRSAREKAAYAGTPVAPDYLRAFNDIREEGKTRGKHLTRREATQHLCNLSRKQRQSNVLHPEIIIADPFLDQCHQADCNDILQKLNDNPPKWLAGMANVDPPFASYTKTKDGKLNKSGKENVLTGGANITEADSIATTCRTLRLLPKLLDRNAPILLWQASNRELRRQYLEVMEEMGLVVEMLTVWPKNRPQPSEFNSAFASSHENCWVLRRKDEQILNHDGSTRHSILDGFPVKDTNEISHWWRKPIPLNEFLVKKLTDPGDVILDCYGCTGSMSIAAIRNDRHFLYCELFEENFKAFSPEIYRELEGAIVKCRG